jgi:hypothetical protein
MSETHRYSWENAELRASANGAAMSSQHATIGGRPVRQNNEAKKNENGAVLHSGELAIRTVTEMAALRGSLGTGAGGA